MIPFEVPAWVWRCIAIAILFVGAIGAYRWWAATLEQRGYDRASKDWTIKEQRISAEAKELYFERWQAAMARGDQLQTQVNDMTAARTATESDHAKSLQSAVAAAVARTERLFVRTQSAACPLPRSAAETNPADPIGSGPVQTTELVPELAGQLVGIAGASAKDVRDYNSLLGYARMIRAECVRTEGDGNAESETPTRP